MRLSIVKILGCVCILLFASCGKRYWYRTKIDLANSKKYSVKIKVVNASNGFFDKDFADVMHKAAAKELKKKGYFEVPIDSPQFLFTLVFKLDSFNAGIPRNNEVNDTLNDDINHIDRKNAIYAAKPPGAPYAFKSTVKAIMFDCELRHYKHGWIKWKEADDIYYFGEYRDIGRSEGMVRHLIKIAKDRQ
jgi:hypothetical protein